MRAPAKAFRSALPGLLSVLLPLSGAACKGSRGRSDTEAGVQDRDAPPARVIRVEQSSVAIEGRWHPIDVAGAADHVTFVVRATCVRSERRCREELTTVRAGHPPATETWEYRVRDWTEWKLTAARPEGPQEVQLRVSLIGLAAEKVTVSLKDRKQPEMRWRLD